MKRASIAVCFTAIVLGVSACQQTPEEPSTGPVAPPAPPAAHDHADHGVPLSPVMVSFAPGDLTSSTGATPIKVFVEKGGQAVDAETLDRLADQIDLRTYPELEPVDAEVTVVESARPGRPAARGGDDKGDDKDAASEPVRDNPGRAALVVRPSRPLAERWYVVSIAAMPEGARPVAWTGVTETHLGAFAARFHPGSQPVLRDVRLCAKAQGRAARVVATFSEGLRVDAARAAGLVRVRDGATGEACALVPPPRADVPQPALELDCPASVLESRAIDFGLSAGLASMTGAPVSSIEARGRGVELNDALDFGDVEEVSGCRTVALQ